MLLLPAWYQRGDRALLADLQREIVDTAPPHPAARCTVALLHARLGDRGRAQTMVEQVVANALKDVRRDLMFLGAMATLARCLDELGHARRAPLVYEALRPYSGRVVVAGAPAQVCWGPVDHYLGVLAALAGQSEPAIGHFDIAIGLGTQLGAAPFVAESQFHAGRVRRLHHGPDDPRAAELLAASRSTAETLGLTLLTEHLEAFGADNGQGDRSPVTVHEGDAPSPHGAPNAASRPDGAAHRQPNEPVRSLVRAGDHWVLETERGIIHVRDMKGVRYLAALVAAPRRQIHVLELTRSAAPGDPSSAVARTSAGELADAGHGYTAGFGDAGELLDETAKRAYREYLSDLDRRIAEADEFHDLEAAASLRAERDLVIDQLTGAVGLGDRDRRAASTTERARVNVTRALRYAIRHIAELDPHVGAALDRVVVTGTFCAYEPDRLHSPDVP